MWCENRRHASIDLEWVRDAETLGLTAGASAPERVVRRVLRTLEGLGPISVQEQAGASETVRFGLPPEVR